MKKIDSTSSLRVFLSLIAAVACMSINAQVVKVYENGSLSATYTNSSTNTVKVVFEEAPSAPAHEYVDLGLPSGTLWATCNVGATSPEEYGLYFAWGETTGHSGADGYSYSWKTAPFNGGNSSYNSTAWENYSSTVIDNNDLVSTYDAATANWGSEWQMPSSDQITELCNTSNTTTEWTIQNGVYGRLITSKTNGNSIFLPAAGCRYDASLGSAGTDGYYWSRTLGPYSPKSAYYLNFYSSYAGWSYNDRYFGQSVRPVRVQ